MKRQIEESERRAKRTKENVEPTQRKDREFVIGSAVEPHVERRAEILKKYPEIKELMGYEWKTKYIVALTVALQLFLGWLSLDYSWPAYLAVIYVFGATANHSLFLAIHELAHNSGAAKASTNKLIGMMANVAIVIPYSVTFKPYHMEHHRCQGQDGVDAAIPSYLEGYLITRTATGYVDHCIRKAQAIMMYFQIFFYALRPMIVKPDLVPKDGWIVLNWVVIVTSDLLIWRFIGLKCLLYLLLCSFFAGSIHPTAGHFLSEHYTIDGVTETYSYYGPLNYLTYNVGYHNEHHDFPSIPWSNLPKVRKIAPEYYDDLPQCSSWTGMLFKYIFDDTISPFSRVKRGKKVD